jgi:peptidyl-prolyl cis-trans isomerase B (cyclophilin B)
VRGRGTHGAAAAAAAAALLVLAGCGGDDDEGTETASSLPEGCEEVAEPAPRSARAERPRRRLQGPVTAVVETSCGTFEIALDTERAPKTTSSFAGLAEQGYYDDTAFARVVLDFVIQGGDPTGTQTGGPGYTVDEPPPAGFSYLRGTAAMAKSAADPPGRSGGQFFIVTAPADAGLPPDYALLGEVSTGLDVVERIESLGDPSGADGPPLEPVIVKTITIRRG